VRERESTHAHERERARAQEREGYAFHVPKIHTLLWEVTTSLSVRVMPVGLEATTTALAAWLANIKLMLGQARAQIVQQSRTRQTTGQSVRCAGTRHRRLRVPALCPVPAMLASRARTAPCACCAPRASTGTRTSGTTGPGRVALRGRTPAPLRKVHQRMVVTERAPWMGTSMLWGVGTPARTRSAH